MSAATALSAKPLGRRGYGSIPHLPGSRLGNGDHHCPAGQEAICLSRVRDRHDRVIVTEKLDGTNVSVARIGDAILAIGRAGYLASTSPFEQHHLFAAWVERQADRFLRALEPGQRFVGEWLAQAHGTRYRLHHEPFVGFDLMEGSQRLPYDECLARLQAARLPRAQVLHDGPACPLETALAVLGNGGFHGAMDPVEGAVWRVERRGAFDFIAKWVRPNKVDGSLLPEISGEPICWNWHPGQ